MSATTQAENMVDDLTAFQSEDSRVRATPPTAAKPYWRLEYELYGRRKQLSGGRTRAQAIAKMALILARLDADLGDDLPQTRGSVMLDAWLNPATPRRGGKVWSGGTAPGHRPYVERYMRPVLGALRAEEFHRRHFRVVVCAATTRKEGEQVRRRLQQLVNWAMRTGYLTELQALMMHSVTWQPPAGYVERPERTGHGDPDEGVLPEEDAMAPEQLAAVGDALQLFYPYGKLFAEFAAATGLRQGELFGLRASDVDRVNRRGRVWEQWNAKAGRRTLPKMGKRRTAMFRAGPTITGYDMAAALAARVAEALEEQQAGKNPLGLLFPAPRGGHWDSSNFDTRVWMAALDTLATGDDAVDPVPVSDPRGVRYVEFFDTYRSGPRRGQRKNEPTRLYQFTCHSLRDRYAISALNVWEWELDELQVAGGWRNTKVIHDRYYGVARGVLDRLQRKTAPSGE